MPTAGAVGQAVPSGADRRGTLGVPIPPHHGIIVGGYDKYVLEMPVLQNQRVIVRPFTMDDLDAVHGLYDTNWGETDAPTGSLDERRAWLAFTVEGYRQFAALYQPPILERAIVRPEDGTVVGAIGMVHTLAPYGQMPWHEDFGTPAERLKSAEYGLFWAIGKPYRGHGYATEAARLLIDYGFTHLGLKRWIATTEHDNVASQAVMRRLGMRVERNPRPDPPWFQIAAVLENPELPPH
jgi:RimJ/RimL family protein N-acetyltransferase